MYERNFRALNSILSREDMPEVVRTAAVQAAEVYATTFAENLMEERTIYPEGQMQLMAQRMVDSGQKIIRAHGWDIEPKTTFREGVGSFPNLAMYISEQAPIGRAAKSIEGASGVIDRGLRFNVSERRLCLFGWL